MQESAIRFYQTGTWTVGNRLLDPTDRTVQSSQERHNALNSGHRACQGCGEALGARYAVDAAFAATNGQIIATNATAAWKSSPRRIPKAPGSCRGSIRFSAIRRPLRLVWPLPRASRLARRAAKPSVSLLWAATAAPPTSASVASLACSSATTTCSISALTTRPT